mmetsp:Transcript_32107/g.70051  ORF Transcript_32107/g.70051 Transcript_32107/m.70051 type:complete len:242 (+) Transcript_32107:194-919(+)
MPSAYPAGVSHTVLQGNFLRAIKKPVHIGANKPLEDVELMVNHRYGDLCGGDDRHAKCKQNRIEALRPRILRPQKHIPVPEPRDSHHYGIVQEIVVQRILSIGGEAFKIAECHGHKGKEAEGHGHSPKVVEIAFPMVAPSTEVRRHLCNILVEELCVVQDNEEHSKEVRCTCVLHARYFYQVDMLLAHTQSKDEEGHVAKRPSNYGVLPVDKCTNVCGDERNQDRALEDLEVWHGQAPHEQ